MKKLGCLSMILVLLLVMQIICVPVFATETAPSETQTEPPQETTEYTIPEVNATFGNVCVSNGCRTIEGMVSLMGGEYVCPTAQGVFVYEKNTGTVV